MAQNIVTAWLVGARLIELKTIQTLDELDVNKPCIDVADEGYNVEWSQELKVHESFDEYLRAWVLIHALHRKLGWPGDRPGIVFNMSVGYNLEGIRRPNVQWYLDAMADASAYLPAYVDIVARRYPGGPRHRHPGAPVRHGHALDDARLPARRDRAHLALPDRGARPAHVGQVQPDAPGRGAGAGHRQRRPGLRRRADP